MAISDIPSRLVALDESKANIISEIRNKNVDCPLDAQLADIAPYIASMSLSAAQLTVTTLTYVSSTQSTFACSFEPSIIIIHNGSEISAPKHIFCATKGNLVFGMQQTGASPFVSSDYASHVTYANGTVTIKRTSWFSKTGSYIVYAMG